MGKGIDMRSTESDASSDDSGTDPLTIIRNVYDRVAAGDFPGLLDLMADDLVVTQAASLPFGGTWRGKQGFTDMAERILGTWPGFAVEPMAFLSDGHERVVVWARLSGQGLAMQMMEMWVVRDSLVRACQPFYFDTAATWAGPGLHR
jgi:uncharacterized protein